MSIVEGKSEYIGVSKNENGKLICEKCKKTNVLLTLDCHMDGTEFYQNNYHCECGNPITIITERSEESKAFWME